MSAILRLTAVAAAAYLLLCVVLYLMQHHLIFVPQPAGQAPEGPQVRPMALARGGVTLRGWIVNPESTGPLLVYFGGNAEALPPRVDDFARLDATTILVNYRGYGSSSGVPSTEALIGDARALVADAYRRHGANRPLILFGRSIGSGLAALATDAAPVDGVILMSPYRSLAHVAQRRLPFVPVRWLLRSEIDATASLATLPDRVLVLHGSTDMVIPAAESQAFAALAGPQVRVVEFDGWHNVPMTKPEIWREVEAFVAGAASR